MQFRLLGPLQVAHTEGPVPLGGRQRRLVLALLLSRPNEAVSTDYLIDGVWGDEPPEAARKSLQAHVASLRRVVNLDGELLRPHPPGYVLEVDADQVDWLAFERAVSVARDRLDSDSDEARQLLVDALGLWRGEALADLRDEAALSPFVARLDQLRLEALEVRIEADLASGDHHAVVGELESHVRDHPLRERLWALLMLALYRSGRQADALRAYQEARRVLGEELGIEPSPLVQELEQRILDQDPKLETRQALETAASVEAGVQLRNPYKGLRAFGQEDAADFFGRRDLVRRLLERLDSRGVEGRLVALAGPSGSGKSSVVKAGLVPALRAGTLGGSENWLVCEMYPGSDPLSELARALAGLGDVSPEDLVTIFQDSAVSLEDIVAEVVERPNTLMVVVDQFEEVFTLVNDPTIRARFLRLVTDAVSDRDGRIRVVLTMRADFLDRPLLHPTLAPLLDHSLVLVTPLSDQEIRAAVVEPAARVGVSVEPDLVAEMIRDVETRPAALPLLQYALTDLFDHRRGDNMTLESYRSTGGITGALAGRADDVFRRLDPAGQEAARQLFLRLVTITDEAEHLRRRVNRSEVENLPVEPSALETVMERFGHYRLLTFDRDPESGEATVEVAHEALLREWPRLSEWIDLEHEGLLLQRRLSAALKEWRQASEDTSYLVGGGRLEQFENWATQTSLALTQDETSFLATSRRFEDQRRRQQKVRRWSLISVLALALVVVSGLALFIRARERTATARELAAAATSVIGTDAQLSLLLALEAVEVDSEAREAVEVLHRAVTATREIWRAIWDGPVAASVAVERSPNESLIAMTGDGVSIQLLDSDTGELIRTLEPQSTVTTQLGQVPHVPDISFSVDGRLLAAVGPDGAVRVWDVDHGEIVAGLTEAHDSGPGRAVFGPKGRWLYTASGAIVPSGLQPVIQWDIATWTEVRRWEVLGLAFDGISVSRDGGLAAIPTDTGIRLFDTENGAQVSAVPEGSAATASFSRPGAQPFSNVHGLSDTVFPHGVLAVAGVGDVSLWDPLTGDPLPIELESFRSGLVGVLEFDHLGERLVAGYVGDGSIGIWNLTRPIQEAPVVLELLGHAGGVGSLGFDPDGRTLVSGSGDRTVRMWDTTPSGRGEVGAFQTRFPNEVRFFDGGRRLAVATGGDRHGMQLIEVAIGTELRVPEAYSLRVGLSSDETTFAAQIAQVDDQGNQLFGADGTPLFEAAMGVWDTRTGELLHEIPAPGEACNDIQPGQYPTFSHDGRYLAVGYACENLVRVWDLSSEQLVAELSHEDQMHDVTFAPSDRYLVAVGSGIVRLWDPEGWNVIQDVTPRSAPRLIEFSSDGELAATPSEDGTVELWLAEDWSSIGVLSGHRGFVNAVAFNGDGSRVVTAGGDHTVRVWDARTREELWNLTGHNGIVVSVDFHPNDRHVASMTGGPAWTIWIWTLDIDELIEIGEARVTRSLTDRECQIYLHAETCPTD